MYNKILVPLDGSKLAESALEHVEYIASGCNVPEVVLVSVTEPVKVTSFTAGIEVRQREAYHVLSHSAVQQSGQIPGPGSEIGDLPEERNYSTRTVGKMYTQADRYLDRIQRRLIKKGVNAKTEVLLGKPAEAIVSYAEKNGVDLIIMSSHGRSGISRWASGSVAERVFRSACVPVMMVRAPGCTPQIT
jgi:nucleotide-binding universal stress UspA family protein